MSSAICDNSVQFGKAVFDRVVERHGSSQDREPLVAGEDRPNAGGSKGMSDGGSDVVGAENQDRLHVFTEEEVLGIMHCLFPSSQLYTGQR